ncbi:MAG TPA: lysophospholipid acyltransferase family protein [Baekduia sp.]|jgi:1-acyl-sn-glycerol-3-phosphate acyltransferase|nr:lysophospholipid acyltransferase family protein [Baekduia sp.]
MPSRDQAVREQRFTYAEQAREKVDRRREDTSGAAGWVADRAGEWSLDVDQSELMELQKYFWNPLMDYWFRMEIEGWEHLPEPPVLVVGVHAGAPFVWDAWTVGIQWWRRFGSDRVLHGTAHDALMAAPLVGSYFRRMGVLPAAPDSIAGALAAGHDVALWPGGEVDSLRPWVQRDEAVLAGRKGFVRMAINAGVPIVPVATVGGPDSMPVLVRGRRLARALRLDKIARLKMFPIGLSAPWGLAPSMLPEIPLPTKIRTAFQPPVDIDPDPARASDEEYVQRKYDEVQDSIQHGMDALARRRAFPLFG